ncbi:DUF6463 family protein [Streptomyces sp. NPDC085524]|uniref:DUF6463 family protein n=1 Tax=Streptomyces sp. NPDC085524 TaxID=3365728 RepID=UPI0037D4ED07
MAALPTRALAATASMVSAAYPASGTNSRTASRVASSTRASRGRPGGCFEGSTGSSHETMSIGTSSAVITPANTDSLRLFWSLPGSFAVPLILLGLLLARMARTGQEVPRYVPWTLAAWVLLSGWILEPAGFPLGLIPVTLLLLAHRETAPKP